MICGQSAIICNVDIKRRASMKNDCAIYSLFLLFAIIDDLLFIICSKFIKSVKKKFVIYFSFYISVTSVM
jgi:hypothetical protein